jgi:hypothetical protein
MSNAAATVTAAPITTMPVHGPRQMLSTAVQVTSAQGDYVRLQVNPNRMSFAFPLQSDTGIYLVSIFGSSNMVKSSPEVAGKLNEWYQRYQANKSMRE